MKIVPCALTQPFVAIVPEGATVGPVFGIVLNPNGRKIEFYLSRHSLESLVSDEASLEKWERWQNEEVIAAVKATTAGVDRRGAYSMVVAACRPANEAEMFGV